MAEITPPMYLNMDGVYRADDIGLPYRDIMGEGVVAAGDLAVSQRGTGANMSVDVAAGAAWVRGDTSTVQPTYRVRSDDVANLAVAAANPSQPRIDLVVAEVRDSTFAGVDDDWRLRVITGTPAGSPSAPSLPVSCLPLAEVLVDAAATSIVDGKITDRRRFAVVGGGDARGSIPGEIRMFGGGTAPYMWLVCDGNAISRMQYAALFAAIGTDFGAGDGTTTFNLPDFRNRVPVGVSGTKSRGATGGAETVTLTEAQMPSHNHGGLTGAMNRNNPHQHYYGVPESHIDTYIGGPPWKAWQGNDNTLTTETDINHEHAIPAQGGGGAHENMPPWLAINYIIYAGE